MSKPTNTGGAHTIGAGARYPSNWLPIPNHCTASPHIPSDFLPVPSICRVEWDADGTPLYYYRNNLRGNHWSAQVALDPVSGAESVDVQLNLDSCTVADARLAVGELCAWFFAAVESHLSVGEGDK